MKNKITISERIQKLKMQKHAGVITESQYEKKLALLEDDTVLGSKDPIPLSQIVAKKDGADAVIGGGVDDGDQGDDAVAGKETSMAVGLLKPAQTEIIVAKAVSFALGFITNGQPDLNDMEAIVSKDNFIMDGHHRWAARFLIDPKAAVNVMVIDLPGGALVTALNLITVGKLGITAGNQGKGNVADFTGANIGKEIDTILQAGSKEWPAKTLKPEQLKEALGKVPGANGDANKGKEIMMKNADALPKTIMPGAPPRVEMPVIDGKKVKMVQTYLAKGTVDIKPPYSAKVKQTLDLKESVYKTVTKMLHKAIKKQK